MIYAICVGWIFGIALMGQTNLNIPHISGLVVIGLFILLVTLFFIYRKIRIFLVQAAIFSISFILMAYVGFNFATTALTQRLIERELKPQQTEVVVYVRKISQLKNDHIQQKIEVLNRHSQPVTWLAQIKKEHHINLELGRYYRVMGKIRPAHSYATEGAFDVEKWYLQQNIMTNFRVDHVELLTDNQMINLGFSSAVQENKQFFSQIELWIEKERLEIRQFILIRNLENKGLILGLLTGDESLLSNELEQQFQRFGVSHLLAISGPHVLIFAILICWIIHQIICRFYPQIYLIIPKPYLLSLPFLFCVLIYCAYVGFEIPAIRTLILAGVTAFFMIFQQKLRPLLLLLLSASILLCFDPFSVLSAAFWLSYGACFILLRVYQTIQITDSNAVTLASKIKIYIHALIESQWKIFIALFPLMIIFFQQISWITPITNLIAIPWLGLVVVPLDIMAGFSYLFFEPLAAFLFSVNDVLISILIGILNILDNWLNPQLYPIYLNFWLILSLIIGIIILFLPKNILARPWSMICFLPIIFTNSSDQDFEFSVLDVGQGQAILIRNQQHNMMIDTGGSINEQQFSIGEKIILPYLSTNSVEKLDYLVLTHLDQDHSGAYFKIKDRLLVQQLISNENLSSAQFCNAGQSWYLGEGVKVSILSPFTTTRLNEKENKNESSCVVYVQAPQAKPYQNFLIMADVGWLTEFKILQHYPNLAVDVLVLGHHGSRHSSAYDFLARIKPKLVIVSSGFDNRYNHPHPVTLARLKALNLTSMNTVNYGTIQIKSGQIFSYRHQKLWLKRDD